jgi:hypothetical protein
MRAKTKELLDFIKRSRAQPRITLDHLRDFLADADTMGHAALLVEAEQLLKPVVRRNRSGAPLGERDRSGDDGIAQSLQALQLRTGLDRPSFIKLVVEQLTLDAHLKAISKKEQTLPGLIRNYVPMIGTDRLQEIALKVAEKHSLAH